MIVANQLWECFELYPIDKEYRRPVAKSSGALLDNLGTIELKRLIKAAGAIHHDARLVARLDRAAVEKKERIGYPRPGDNLYCFSRLIPRSCRLVV